jgi:NAD(P)-dependent dehydrogenase (short-subunit alcohol dehydrogenase family)
VIFFLSPSLSLSLFLAVQHWADAVHRRWGRIDGLVNNAAAFVFGKIEEVSEEHWETVLNTNVKGYAYCIKHCIPFLRKSGGGSIVNMSSQSAHIAQPAFTPYNTSKGAIEQLSKCVALDYGCENIRSNTVCPGTIRTPATYKHAEKLGVTIEKLTEMTVADLCLKRLGTPDDVANCVTFLLSDASSYVTGSALMVDGGYTTK